MVRAVNRRSGHSALVASSDEVVTGRCGRTPAKYCLGNPRGRDGLLDIVYSHDACALENAHNQRRECAFETVAVGKVECFAEEVLIGHRDQRRIPEGSNLVEPPREFERMIGVLVKVVTGI